MSTTQGPGTLPGITEAEIANYLVHNPGFFDRHAELLASVQLTSPHGQRAVSLQERQMEMLRERIKGLEQKIVELIRTSQDNAAIADRLHQWTMRIVHTRGAGALPQVLLDDLQQRFMIPQVALRLWDVAEPFAELRVAKPVSDDLKAFASSLSAPYCGANAGFEASGWFEQPMGVLSMAMLPLRRAADEPAFGLLVLGSPDPTRYGAQMGTEFLARLAEVASAALGRLLRTE